MNISHTCFPNGHVCNYRLIKEKKHDLFGYNRFGDFIYVWYNICKIKDEEVFKKEN